MLGQLSPIYLFRSNFLIQPWLAACHGEPRWRPNEAEVAELIQLPLAALCDTANRRKIERGPGPLVLRAPAFVWRGHEIWGATALILAELAAVAAEVAPEFGR